MFFAVQEGSFFHIFTFSLVSLIRNVDYMPILHILLPLYLLNNKKQGEVIPLNSLKYEDRWRRSPETYFFVKMGGMDTLLLNI